MREFSAKKNANASGWVSCPVIKRRHYEHSVFYITFITGDTSTRAGANACPFSLYAAHLRRHLKNPELYAKYEEAMAISVDLSKGLGLPLENSGYQLHQRMQ